jgi:hypothetical protein
MTAHTIRHRERAARDGEHLPAEPTRTELAHLRAAITLAEPNPMRTKSAATREASSGDRVKLCDGRRALALTVAVRAFGQF